MRIFIISFNRASDEAVDNLIAELKRRDIYTDNYDESTMVIAVADRSETFDWTLKAFRDNKDIVHLAAGEVGCWTVHDDAYRHAITLMSDMQLVINEEAKDRVIRLCKAVDKIPNIHIIGNYRLDSLDTDESNIPDKPYDVVLYNPPSRYCEEAICDEIEGIGKLLIPDEYIWIEPNGDKGSEYIYPYVTTKTLPRAQFLGLLKNCRRFITNSSCQFTEAQFVMDPDNIIQVGDRNWNRESKYTDQSKYCDAKTIVDIIDDRWLE